MDELLKNSGFYDDYRTLKNTGTWASNRSLSAMKVAYSEATKSPKKPQGETLKTGCAECIRKAAELIYNTWPL